MSLSNQYLSTRLNKRQFNVLAMHCQRIGVSYQKLSNNRLLVDDSSDTVYTGLMMLENHSINAFQNSDKNYRGEK